jgi:murein DD-endopeptidase MepM/ murein hydrolase activator NlpD
MHWIGNWLFLAALAVHPVLDVQPAHAHPGDPVLIGVRGRVFEATGSLGKLPLRFYRTKAGAEAMAALPENEPEGRLEVRVKVQPAQGSETAIALHRELTVSAPDFPRRELTVDNKFVEKPPPEIERQIHEDHEAFAKAFDQAFAPRLFEKGFGWPRPHRVTASFGELRLFNGKKSSQHQGLDLKGKLGQPIHAGNDGIVVMVRDCYASGNTVVLYHGGELFTLYLHLSKVDVRPGQHVTLGKRLGLVGQTGRVTGPHLHWAAKVGNRYVNPETLIRLHFLNQIGSLP